MSKANLSSCGVVQKVTGAFVSGTARDPVNSGYYFASFSPANVRHIPSISTLHLSVTITVARCPT
jgi:hypothetical protein